MARGNFNISNPKIEDITFVLNDQVNFYVDVYDNHNDLFDVTGYDVLMQAKDDNGTVVYEWSTDSGTVTISTSRLTFSSTVTIDTEGQFNYDIEVNNGTDRKQTIKAGIMYVIEDVSEV